jgi:hypothetical protein
MFAALVRENEIVRLPSGRLGTVESVDGQTVEGLYLDNGEPWMIRAKHLEHVSSKLAGGVLNEESH